MIPVTLANLLTRQTEAQTLDACLQIFRDLGFSVDSWKPGGTMHTLLRVHAKLIWQTSAIVSQIAAGGYLDLCSGIWLTLLARSHWQEERRAATYAYQRILLTSTSIVPTPISVGSVWVSDNGATEHRFSNVATDDDPGPWTLPAGDTLELTFKAESPGGGYNVAPGGITKLLTALPGVTVTNTAIQTQGLDEQTDAELRNVCRLKWATLSAGRPTAFYEYYALKSIDGTTRAGVTRAWCNSQAPDGPNTLRVYIAGPAGAVSEEIRASVDADLQELKAAGAIVRTISASNRSVNPGGTIYVSGVTKAAAEAERYALWNSMIAAMPIGGERIGGTRAIFNDAIQRALASMTGLRRIHITTADHTMTATQVAVGSAGGLLVEVI